MASLTPDSGRRGSERFGQADEDTAAGSELRCAHTDAGAIAEFIDVIQSVGHIAAHFQRPERGGFELV